MIDSFLFIPSFGFVRTAFHQLNHGSSITSSNIVPLTLLANQCERVALLRSLKPVLQGNLFEVLAVGHPTLSSDTYKTMWSCSMPSFLGGHSIIHLILNFFPAKFLLVIPCIALDCTCTDISPSHHPASSFIIIIIIIIQKKKKKKTSTFLPLASLLYSLYK
jgi:hypothetical protein